MGISYYIHANAMKLAFEAKAKDNWPWPRVPTLVNW